MVQHQIISETPLPNLKSIKENMWCMPVRCAVQVVKFLIGLWSLKFSLNSRENVECWDILKTKARSKVWNLNEWYQKRWIWRLSWIRQNRFEIWRVEGKDKGSEVTSLRISRHLNLQLLEIRVTALASLSMFEEGWVKLKGCETAISFMDEWNSVLNLCAIRGSWVVWW